MTLILGTSSVFRRQLFQEYFKDYIIKDNGDIEQFINPDIDEKSIRNPYPEKLCQEIANAKCVAILEKHKEKLPKDAIILTFDQVVVCNGDLREKPQDEIEARKFLKSYADGSKATALSGVIAHNVKNGRRVCLLDKVTVKFDKFPEEVVDHLVKEGEIFLASGSFTIGDRELGKYVKEMDGTIDQIEGFPVIPLQKCIELVTKEIKFPPERPLAQITHILFDMDGLLLDTELLYTKAQQKVLDEFGLEFTPEVKSKMMGRKALEAVEVMIDHYGVEMNAEKFIEDRNALLQEMFPNCDLMPGVLRLLTHLKLHKVPMAVATSSHKKHFDLKTAKHKKLFDTMFDFVINGDDVSRSKPDPEIFMKSAEKYDAEFDPTKFLVFEDAPVGVEAANRAQMNVIWVYDWQNPDNDSVKCTEKMKNLFFFKPEIFGLPPFKSK